MRDIAGKQDKPYEQRDEPIRVVDALTWRESESTVITFGIEDQILSRGLVHGKPWIVPRRRRGQPNRTGDFYFSTLRRHVAYDSLVELSLLLLLDHQQTVAGILSQPFLMRFQRDDAKSRHIPDYLVLRADGSQEIWDVRPNARIDDRLKETAALTREFCTAAGFSFFLYDGLSRAVLRNLEWLHAYSHERYAPTRQRERARVLGYFEGGRALKQALRELDAPQRILRMWIYHLLWTTALRTDLTHPMSDESVIETTGSH